MTTALQPAFQRVPTEEKSAYDLFFDYTSNTNIQSYASGWSLEKLTDLAERAYETVRKTNPILVEGSPQTAVVPGRQWEIDRLSDIKQRVARAIDCKRSYYENHWLGIITKYVLKCLGRWNNGETAAIAKAEDFLIMYDSRIPMFKNSEGFYESRCFFVLTSASWVRANLDTSRFFNYNPRRTIPAVQNFRYDGLDPTNPLIFIRG